MHASVRGRFIFHFNGFSNDQQYAVAASRWRKCVTAVQVMICAFLKREFYCNPDGRPHHATRPA